MRQRKAPWTRSVLGLFVVVWLNVALQPCALAYGGSTGIGRAHCPPVQTEDVSARSEDGASQSDSNIVLCETSSAQCAFVDDFNYDGRVIEVKVKHEPSVEPFAIVPPFPVIALDDHLIANARDHGRLLLPGDQSRCNVFYCVYLI